MSTIQITLAVTSILSVVIALVVVIAASLRQRSALKKETATLTALREIADDRRVIVHESRTLAEMVRGLVGHEEWSKLVREEPHRLKVVEDGMSEVMSRLERVGVKLKVAIDKTDPQAFTSEENHEAAKHLLVETEEQFLIIQKELSSTIEVLQAAREATEPGRLHSN